MLIDLLKGKRHTSHPECMNVTTYLYWNVSFFSLSVKSGSPVEEHGLIVNGYYYICAIFKMLLCKLFLKIKSFKPWPTR